MGNKGSEMQSASTDADQLRARLTQLEQENQRLKAEVQQLKDQKELKSKALETAHIGTWKWDLNTDEISWSDEVYDLYNISRDQFDGSFDAYLSLIHEEDRDKVYEQIQKVLNLGRSTEYQVKHRIKTSDGSTMWLHGLGRLLVDENGIPRQLMGVIYNVTDSMNEQMNDRELQKKYQMLVEQTLFGLYILQDGDIIYANGKAANLLGYTPEEITGKPFFDILTKEDRRRVKHVMEARSKGQIDVFEYELNLKQKSGGLLPVLIHSGMIRYDGEPAILGTILDISDRIQAEQVLYEQEQQLRQILEQLPTIIWTTDHDLKFTSSSGSGLSKLGLKPNEMKGTSLYTYFDDPEGKLLPIKMHKRALQGESVQFEYAHQNLVFQTAIDPLLDREGNVIGCIANAVDITEIKDTQSALQQSVSEKEVLLAEMHHRVKNNLALIHGMLDLQQRSTENESVGVELQQTKSRVQSIAIVHEMLYASDELHHVQMESYIQRLSQALLKDREASESIELTMNVDALTLPITQAVPCGLIINELMNNAMQHAFDHTVPNPSIHLSLKQQQENIHLSIHDNGIGLDEALELDNSPSLGFNIVKQLTRQLKAECDINRNGGTEISIQFPIQAS
jgi:PAS domain S-box-containing protein